MLCTAAGVIPRLPSRSPEEPCRRRRSRSGHRCLPEEVRRRSTADGLNGTTRRPVPPLGAIRTLIPLMETVVPMQRVVMGPLPSTTSIGASSQLDSVVPCGETSRFPILAICESHFSRSPDLTLQEINSAPTHRVWASPVSMHRNTRREKSAILSPDRSRIAVNRCRTHEPSPRDRPDRVFVDPLDYESCRAYCDARTASTYPVVTVKSFVRATAW